LGDKLLGIEARQLTFKMGHFKANPFMLILCACVFLGNGVQGASNNVEVIANLRPWAHKIVIGN
jgi:hypothetical protein